MKIFKADTISPSKVKQALRILLMSVVGFISSIVFTIFLIFNLCFPLAPFFAKGQEEFFLVDCGNFIVSATSPFTALFGIWVTLKLMNKKTNYFYLFIAAAIFLAIQLIVPTVFSKEIASQFNGISFFSALLVLPIIAEYFTPKPTK